MTIAAAVTIAAPIARRVLRRATAATRHSRKLNRLRETAFGRRPRATSVITKDAG